MRLAGVVDFEAWVPSRDGSCSLRVFVARGEAWGGEEEVWEIWALQGGETGLRIKPMSKEWIRHACAMLGASTPDGSLLLTPPFGRLMAACLYRSVLTGWWPGCRKRSARPGK